MFARSVVFVLLTAVLGFGQSKQLTIAAAADLGPALKEITAAFEKRSGVTCNVILGSSGNFFAQIQNGAPYDIFLSADREYAKKLQDAGLAEHLSTYAEGSIVLWVRNDSNLDLRRGLDVLLDARVKKISIANPAHAPYGRAAMSALEHFHVADRVNGKFVLGENIAQTAQFVQTGNADIGIIALSLALAPGLKPEGRYWEIPRETYPPLEQASVILPGTAHRKAALEFQAYLASPVGKEILQRFGFRTPQSAAAQSSAKSSAAVNK